MPLRKYLRSISCKIEHIKHSQIKGKSVSILIFKWSITKMIELKFDQPAQEILVIIEMSNNAGLGEPVHMRRFIGAFAARIHTVY